MDEASRQMHSWLLHATGRAVSAPPEAERLSRALADWERVRGRGDHDEEKMAAAFALEAATKASEESRRPRNEDGTYASFDAGHIGGRRTFQHDDRDESATQLLRRSFVQHYAEQEAA
jgi:hypothetical protein